MYESSLIYSIVGVVAVGLSMMMWIGLTIWGVKRAIKIWKD